MSNLRPRKGNVNYCELSQNSQDTSDSENNSSSDSNNSADSEFIQNSETQEDEYSQIQGDEEEEDGSEMIATTTNSKGKKYNVSSSQEEEEEEELSIIHVDDDENGINNISSGDNKCGDVNKKKCLVCASDKREVLIRYNVMSCEPCAKFFSKYNYDTENSICLADPDKCCEDAFRLKNDRFKKNFCPNCRFDKCIKVGMRKKVIKLPNGKTCGTFSCNCDTGKCLCCETVLAEETYEVEIEGDDGVKVSIDLVLDKKNKFFCTSQGFVYCLFCPLCQVFYVGIVKWGKFSCLSHRMNGHRKLCKKRIELDDKNLQGEDITVELQDMKKTHKGRMLDFYEHFLIDDHHKQHFNDIWRVTVMQGVEYSDLINELENNRALEKEERKCTALIKAINWSDRPDAINNDASPHPRQDQQQEGDYENLSPLLRPRQPSPETTIATTITTLPPNPLPSTFEQARSKARKRKTIEAQFTKIDEEINSLKEKKSKINAEIDSEIQNLQDIKTQLNREKDKLSDDISSILLKYDSGSDSDL